MALIFNIVDKHGHLDVGVIITVYNIRVRVVSDQNTAAHVVYTTYIHIYVMFLFLLQFCVYKC